MSDEVVDSSREMASYREDFVLNWIIWTMQEDRVPGLEPWGVPWGTGVIESVQNWP